MAWLTELEGLAQPARFPWLLFRVVRALSRFTTQPDGGMVVASTVGHRDHVAMETVGCMVATVLYRWRGDMGWEEWLEHVITVQGQCEVPLEALGLPLHPESHTPLTPVMVDLALQKAAPPPAKRSLAFFSSCPDSPSYLAKCQSGIFFSCLVISCFSSSVANVVSFL